MMHEKGHQGPLLHGNMLTLPRWQEVALSRTVVCFAGTVLGALFRDSSQPDIDFGSNIAGVTLGGLCESLSFVIGFRYLLIVAVAFYLLSAVSSRRSAGFSQLRHDASRRGPQGTIRLGL
jgi:hypothetical protein